MMYGCTCALGKTIISHTNFFFFKELLPLKNVYNNAVSCEHSTGSLEHFTGMGK